MERNSNSGIDWKKFQSGDETEFRRLYDAYAEMLYAYGMKMAQNEDLVRENLQLLFVYLYEKRTTILCPDNITAYLFASFRNRMFKALAAQTKQNALVGGEVTDNYDFRLDIDIQESIARDELDRERIQALQTALQDLSPQQREVVYLRFYKGMGVEDVAKILGTTNQTVSNVTHNAILKLRSNELLSKSFLLACMLVLRNMIE